MFSLRTVGLATVFLSFAACRTAPLAIEPDRSTPCSELKTGNATIWSQDSDRVVMLDMVLKEQLPSISGIAYKGYGSVWLWKALLTSREEDQEWIVVMELPDHSSSKEFSASIGKLGEAIANNL